MERNLPASIDQRFIQAIAGEKSKALDKAVEWIRNNIDPDEIYSLEQLSEWAIDNGFEPSK